MRGRRHFLIVSWWYPPFTEGGVYRPLHFSRHLVEHGHRVTVLTGRPAPGFRIDESLLARIPPEVRVLRAPYFDPFRCYDRIKGWLGRSQEGTAPSTPPSGTGEGPPGTRAGWKDRVSESLLLPDRWRSWHWPACLVAAQALRGDEPDLVFSTSPPHSMHPIGAQLARMFDCPWVADFRDPWVGNPFRGFTHPVLVEADRALERRALTQATEVVVNTKALERRLRRRYPTCRRVRTIPNGYAADSEAPPTTGTRTPPFELLHVGLLYGPRSGRYLLQGLERLRRQAPAAAALLRVRLVGSIDHEDGFRAELGARNLEDLVAVEERVSHARALELQRAADGLLLLGIETPEVEVQVPGKVYEYFAARRPVLALSRQGGAIQEVLEEARHPHLRAEPDDPEGIARALQGFVEALAEGRLEVTEESEADRFRYDRLTWRLLQCFEDALTG